MDVEQHDSPRALAACVQRSCQRVGAGPRRGLRGADRYSDHRTYGGRDPSRYSLTLATSSCAKAMNLRRSFSATSRSSAPKAVSSLFVTSWSSRLGDDLTSRFCLDCGIEKVVSCLLL